MPDGYFYSKVLYPVFSGMVAVLGRHHFGA